MADKLDALRNEYLGTNWRCVNSMGKERQGDVVQINDVSSKGNQYFASFDSGSKVNIDIMTDYLMRAEDSIDMGGAGGTFDKINEHDPYAGITVAPILPPVAFKSKNGAGPIPMPPGTSLLDMPMKSGPIQIPENMSAYSNMPLPAQQFATPIPKAESIFKMFDTKQKELPINIALDFPDIQLLKMMYKNAADKDKFVNELSSYVYSNINKNAVAEALSKMIGANQKTKISNDPRVHEQEPDNGRESQ